MKKIVVQDEHKQWHTFKAAEGTDLKFYANPEFNSIEIVRMIKDPDTGESDREVIASFRNYKLCKEGSPDRPATSSAGRTVDYSDSQDATSPTPAPHDPYTEAALAARSSTAPDFTVLDKDRPIGDVTGQAADKEVTPPIWSPNPAMTMEEQANAFNELMQGITKHDDKMAAQDAAAINGPAPSLADTVERFGIKKGSDLMPKMKPPVSDQTPYTEEEAAVMASVQKKWDDAKVDLMTEEQLGTWMGNLDPRELTVLVGLHDKEIKSGLVRMTEPALPSTAKAVPQKPKRARKPRATEKEKRENQPPPPPPAPQTEAEIMDTYQTIAAAENRHQSRRRMCPSCHDTGIIPDPQNPESTIVCPSC